MLLDVSAAPPFHPSISVAAWHTLSPVLLPVDTCLWPEIGCEIAAPLTSVVRRACAHVSVGCEPHGEMAGLRRVRALVFGRQCPAAF